MSIEHGTIGTYTNLKCRCKACRTAWNRYQREWKRSRREAGSVPAAHGLSGYTNYGCRCDVCSEAKRVYRQQWHAQRAADGAA